MKNLKLLTLLWVVLITCTLAWCWNNNANTDTDNSWDLIIEDVTGVHDAVINYNDSLVEIASQCIMSEDAILADYENGSDGIQTAINNTISECQNSINQINALWDWEGDSSLKDWIINILELDISYFTKFSGLLPYLTSDELTEEEADKYNALVEEINALDQEMEVANNNLVEIQSQFAQNHWYQLEEPTED